MVRLCGRKDKTARDIPRVNALLLGTGGAGKSTIMSSMRLLYGQVRNAEENMRCGVMVRANVVGVMRKLMVHLRKMDLMETLDAEAYENKHAFEDADVDDPIGLNSREAFDLLEDIFTDKENRSLGVARGNSVCSSYQSVTNYVPENHPINPNYSCAALEHYINHDSYLFEHHLESIRMVWQSETMQKVWADRHNVQGLHSSQAEFFFHLSRIASPDYVPLETDILNTYLPTKLVSREKFDMDGTPTLLTDVGGRTSERKRWRSLFDNMDVVIVVAALSDFDQYNTISKPTDDENAGTTVTAIKVNKLVEALDVFQESCSHPDLDDYEIFLFLNKDDCFKKKIRHVNIRDIPEFSDFDGPNSSYEAGINYFLRKFKSRYPRRSADKDESIDDRIMITNATDIDKMDEILEKVRVKFHRLSLKKLTPKRRKSM